MPKHYPTTQEKRDRIFAKLQRSTAGIGEDALFSFSPSNMAAGPCVSAALLDGKQFTAGSAPLPPFDDCPHPDQCACMYGGGRPRWMDED